MCAVGSVLHSSYGLMRCLGDQCPVIVSAGRWFIGFPVVCLCVISLVPVSCRSNAKIETLSLSSCSHLLLPPLLSPARVSPSLLQVLSVYYVIAGDLEMSCTSRGNLLHCAHLWPRCIATGDNNFFRAGSCAPCSSCCGEARSEKFELPGCVWTSVPVRRTNCSHLHKVGSTPRGGGVEGKKEFAYLKWASHCWLSNQNFFFPQRKIFLGLVWVRPNRGHLPPPPPSATRSP